MILIETRATSECQEKMETVASADLTCWRWLQVCDGVSMQSNQSVCARNVMIGLLRHGASIQRNVKASARMIQASSLLSDDTRFLNRKAS